MAKKRFADSFASFPDVNLFEATDPRQPVGGGGPGMEKNGQAMMRMLKDENPEEVAKLLGIPETLLFNWWQLVKKPL